MYYPLKWLKRLNFGTKKTYIIYQRSLNISAKYWRKVSIFTSRGLYPVKYYGGINLLPNRYKYGMFAFTRKPFAIPEKRLRIKKR